jgi:NAD(P)-dependent dehydrogenase (short-subunit alcohol dehydrogenase family)
MNEMGGKVALITGAASGIGRATAELLAARGARIAAVDREAQALGATVGAISSSGGEAVPFVFDLAEVDLIDPFVAEVAEKMGGLDVLVNNAATYVLRDFFTLGRDEWQSVLDVNLTAYFLCARAAARVMRLAGSGSIVNIASVHRVISEPNSGAYAASKGAVAQLTRNLAIELAPYSIVVNSISPGFIRTAMSIVNGVDETATEQFRTSYVNSGRIPLRRAGCAEEVAAAVLFLASRECTYMTGADLVVDGGLTITL